MVPETIRHFIGGSEAPGTSADTFAVTDPATGTEYARAESGVEADVSQAVFAAQAAFADGPWAALTAEARAAALERIAAGIESRAGRIADFEVLGAGLPAGQARQQVGQAAECFRHAAVACRALAGGSAGGQARQQVGQAAECFRHAAVACRALAGGFPGGQGLTLRRPGVAGVVTSWRSPFLAQARGIAPALAAGCTVVLQPDAWAPLSAALLPEILTEAGLPAGALNIVHGGVKPAARDTLVSYPDVPLLWFTGHGNVAEQVARSAAAHHKRVSWDVTANAPCVILDDADAGRAAGAALFGALALNGTRRTATTRVLAARPVYEAVVARLAAAAARVRVGPPADPATELGPLVHAEQLDWVLSCVRRAVKDGARLAAGGRRAPGLAEGNYLGPTVLADVTQEMPAFAEVMSAPVMCVTPFDTDEEAATLARAVAGEAPAYLWTADQDRAERVALAIDAPLTWINAHNPADQRTQAEETATRDAVDFYTRPTPVRTGPDDAPVSL